jgi:hypothetical protein
MNFVPIKLEVEQAIKDFAIADILKKSEPEKVNFQYAVDHTDIPSDLLNDINSELNSKGIPDLLYCKSYIRRKKHVQEIHIDGLNCAINIPLKGSAGSRFCYYTGSYKMHLTVVRGLKFYALEWDGLPILENELELNTTHLVRVDRPHCAIASNTENRWIFTMRFKGNPTFEDLYQKIIN